MTDADSGNVARETGNVIFLVAGGADNTGITYDSDFLFDDFVETPYIGVSFYCRNDIRCRDAMRRVSTFRNRYPFHLFRFPAPLALCVGFARGGGAAGREGAAEGPARRRRRLEEAPRTPHAGREQTRATY